MCILIPFIEVRSYLRRASSQPTVLVSCGHRHWVVSLTHKAINGPERKASIPAVHSLTTDNSHGGEISFGRRLLNIIFG